MQGFPSFKCNKSNKILAASKEKYIAKIGSKMLIIDVSGIIEKFNVYVTLAIIPRTKNIKRAF